MKSEIAFYYIYRLTGIGFTKLSARSKRIRELDLRLQRSNPPLGFPCRQVLLEQFWLIRLGAEGAERRQLARRHWCIDLVGEAGHRGLQRIFASLPTLNLKFVLYLFL